MATHLVIIGLSTYHDDRIAQLPGVKNDIARVRDYFALWGVKEENIYCLFDEDAQKEDIINLLRITLCKQIEAGDTLIIYYAGHGKKITEQYENEKYYLICHDSNFSDLSGSSIGISELIRGAYRGDPQNLYVFIDACEVGISGISDTLVEQVGTNNARSFCIITATRGKDTIEMANGGVFTTALLKAISLIQVETEGYFSALVASIEKTLEEMGYSAPQSLHMGDEVTHPLVGFQKSYTCQIGTKQYVLRSDSLSVITDAILQNPDKKCFNVFGAAKMGKTVLAMQLEKCFSNFVYCSIDLKSNVEKIKSDISRASTIKLQGLGRMPSFGSDIAFDVLANYIVSERIYLSIILDHGERISIEEYIQLCQDLINTGFISIISFSRVKCHYSESVYIPCPKLSIKEYETFLQLFADNSTITVYKGRYKLFDSKPQELMDRLRSKPEDAEKKKECSICVCNTGGFVDDKLFSSLFNISLVSIAELIESGYIMWRNECYYPHETLYEELSIEKDSMYSSPEAEIYWEKQIQNDPLCSYACRQVQELVIHKGTEWLKNPKSTMKILVDSDIKNCNWEGLECIVPYLIEYQYSDLILNAGNHLAHVARGQILNNDIDIREIMNLDEMLSWEIICSEIDYWKGNFTQSIQKAQKIVENNRITKNTVLYQYACLNIGIAHFFLGEWALAKENLEQITECVGRLYGWKQLIYGTILAIRGENFDEGTTMLNNSIKILLNAEDYTGTGIAYGNIGECYVKKGQYSVAKNYLEEGRKYALLTHDNATLLEIVRNEVLASIYSKGLYDTETEELIKQVTDLLNIVNDKTELMQVYNTLSISAIYNYKIDQSKEYYNKAASITDGNQEYEIYTNLSKAAIDYVEGEEKELENDLFCIYDLATKGNNLFSIQQTVKTIHDISKIYCLAQPNYYIFKEMEKINNEN